MKAILIAGGKGERLRPLTYTLPKPMIDVSGKPLLEHIINLFKRNGITDFIISVCYLPLKITNYFGDGKKFGVNIEYIYEKENFPLGTAGSIYAAKKMINSTFIVTYADILRELNIAEMVKFHKYQKAFATLNIYKRFGENPKSLVLFNKNNRITRFIERPIITCHSERARQGRRVEESYATARHSSTRSLDISNTSVGITNHNINEIKKDFVWANGSFYIFETSVFDYIPQNMYCDFGKDVFPKILKERKKLFAFASAGLFIDIGNTKKLAKARNLFH